jgi:quinol monooxygenase YgiN
MSTMIAHIVINEGKEAEFEAVTRGLFTASHRDEPRLLAYGFWRAAEPRHYYGILAFEDYVAFMEHQISPHHENPAATLRDCIQSINVEFCDPVQGSSKMRPSNPQELPADAPQIMREYAKRFPVNVPDWWKRLRSVG